MEPITTKLFNIENAFDFSDAHRKLFTDSMREMAEYHIERSQVFRGICEQYGFKPDSIETYEDVITMPHIFVTAFKLHKLLSVPETEIYKVFTSSGTQGQKSQINLDRTSFDRQAGMREKLVRAMGISSDRKANYIVFSYSPEISGQKGAAHTFNTYTTFAPAAEKVYALEAGATGEAEFDVDHAIKTLVRFEKTGFPLRVIGFLAFSYVTFEEMSKRGIKLQFPKESILVTGGGWKSHTGKTVTFEQYAELVSEVLGIPQGQIRDFYGMVEHGVPYLSCSRRRFHVPIFGNVAAIDPGTQKVLPRGETGLLKLQTSFARSSPSLSVLSTDLGTIGNHCECGLHGDYIMLRGRAGVSKHAGCAISASQLIKM